MGMGDTYRVGDCTNVTIEPSYDEGLTELLRR